MIALTDKLLRALDDALEWIDAVPQDTQLPAMPGFNRDDVNELMNAARLALQKPTERIFICDECGRLHWKPVAHCRCTRAEVTFTPSYIVPDLRGWSYEEQRRAIKTHRARDLNKAREEIAVMEAEHNAALERMLNEWIESFRADQECEPPSYAVSHRRQVIQAENPFKYDAEEALRRLKAKEAQ